FGFLAWPESGVISVSGRQLTGADGKTWAFAGSEVQLQGASVSVGAVVIRGGALTIDSSRIVVTALNLGDAADVRMESSVALSNFSSIEATALVDFENTRIASMSPPTISIAGLSSLSTLGAEEVNHVNL